MTASPSRAQVISISLIGLAVIALSAGIVIQWPKEGVKPERPTAQPAEQPSLVSQPRPAFSMPDLSGASRAIQEWDGKVVAVNFWATWCGPCKEEIPAFNALQRQYGPKGIQFIGIALDDRAAVQDYVKSNPIDYPVLVDGENAAMQLAIRYGNDQGAVPYTAFIDRRGRIAFLQYGSLSTELARGIIESLL